MNPFDEMSAWSPDETNPRLRCWVWRIIFACLIAGFWGGLAWLIFS